jgi:hypothetical protein
MCLSQHSTKHSKICTKSDALIAFDWFKEDVVFKVDGDEASNVTLIVDANVESS